MSERVMHALNPTSEGLPEGVTRARTSSLPIECRRQPGNVGADHVVVEDSIRGPNPAAVTIGIQRCISRPELWRSMAIIARSHKAGIEYLPAIFGGEAVEHFNPSARESDVNSELAGVR
jgi:hypothetical protein